MGNVNCNNKKKTKNKKLKCRVRHWVCRWCWYTGLRMSCSFRGEHTDFFVSYCCVSGQGRADRPGCCPSSHAEHGETIDATRTNDPLDCSLSCGKPTCLISLTQKHTQRRAALEQDWLREDQQGRRSCYSRRGRCVYRKNYWGNPLYEHRLITGKKISTDTIANAASMLDSNCSHAKDAVGPTQPTKVTNQRQSKAGQWDP